MVFVICVAFGGIVLFETKTLSDTLLLCVAWNEDCVRYIVILCCLDEDFF